jgi:transcription initiation factor TFIID subunit 15
MASRTRQARATELVSFDEIATLISAKLTLLPVMGDIPAQADMISTIVTFPGPNEQVQADQDFDITVQIDNLVAGTFTNPDTTYYTAPQQLQGGKIVGHTHITVQDLQGDINTKTPPNPETFSFFKGINDAGDGNGGLTANVAGGLPAGSYRVCTMVAASNHQPVIMPVSSTLMSVSIALANLAAN